MGEVIKNILSEKGDISSKRVAGLLGLLCAVVLILYQNFRYGNTDINKSLIETLVWASMGLLGITAFSGLGSNKKSK